MNDELASLATPAATIAAKAARPRTRLVGSIIALAAAGGVSIVRASLVSSTERWGLVVLAIVLILLAERLLALPPGSVVLGYCVIGLSPDLILGWVQVAPVEIVTSVLVISLLVRRRRPMHAWGSLRGLEIAGAAWLCFGVALAIGTSVSAVTGPPLNTSAIGELLRWWFAPAVALAAMVAGRRSAVGVVVGLLASGVTHAVLICYQNVTWNLFQARPSGLMSTGSSIQGEIVANPNAAGVAAAVVAVLAVGLAVEFAERRPGQLSRRQSLALVLATAAAAALSGLGALLTLSRSAWLLLALGCLFVAWRTRRKRVLAFLVVGALVLLAVPSTQGRLLRTFESQPSPGYARSPHQGGSQQTIERASITDRTEAWRLAVNEGATRAPVVGLGPQTLERLAATPADNSYLQAFVNAGLIGAISLLVLAVSAPFALLRKNAEPGATASIASFAAIAAFGNYWFDPRLLFLWMLLLGFALAWRGSRKSARAL